MGQKFIKSFRQHFSNPTNYPVNNFKYEPMIQVEYNKLNGETKNTELEV